MKTIQFFDYFLVLIQISLVIYSFISNFLLKPTTKHNPNTRNYFLFNTCTCYRMTEKEKRKELKDRRKQEKKLRGAGNVEEMGDLIGLKHKAKVSYTFLKHKA